MFRKVNKIHFVGIGGIGMSGIAELLLNQGFEVSGSDIVKSEITNNLKQKGATIHIGHQASNLKKAEALVFSSAVSRDNVELIRASEKKIPIIKRAEMLGELIALKNTSIAIGGTHGKTSTSSMIGALLSEANLDPTLIVGGLVKNINSNSKLGLGDVVVVEADEYDKSFLQLRPTLAIITNIEKEHMDCYRDIKDLKDSFAQFANSVPFYGSVILCDESKEILSIKDNIKKPITTYGFSSSSNVYATSIEFDMMKTTFMLMHKDNECGRATINVPGKHNVLNALAAAALGFELGLNDKTILKGLNSYEGVRRRFELKGKVNDTLIVDDYAHHPTEVTATLEAAKNSWNKRLIAIFQPHLFSRTKDFYKDFANSLSLSDIVIVTDIYPAREIPINGITGELVYEELIRLGHKKTFYEPTMDRLPDLVSNISKNNDMIITLGAGTIWRYAEKIVNNLKANHNYES